MNVLHRKHAAKDEKSISSYIIFMNSFDSFQSPSVMVEFAAHDSGIT